MKREIVYHIEVSPSQLTKQEAMEQDQRQPWRKQISSWEMEDLCALQTLIIWAKNIMDKPHMRDLTRRNKAYSLARSGIGMLKKALEKTVWNVSAVQCRTMDANFQHITLSSTQLAKGFVNVDTDTLETLIQGTLESCREKFCMTDERESRKCPYRQALDNTLNAGRIRNKRDTFLDGLCPYCLKGAKE